MRNHLFTSRLPTVAIFWVAAACLFSRSALAEVDDAVQTRATGLVVKSGDTAHNVGEDMTKLDGMRAKILTAIAAKTDAKDYNIADELKTLEMLDRYSSRLADLVVIKDPNAKDVIAWLQANAAVAGAWREAYTGTAKFSDNTRMAELKAIETRIGRKFRGGMGTDIKGLHAIDDSASSSAALEELGKRVRLASGLVSKQPGLITLALKVQPAVVNAGGKVTTVVGVALGGGGGDGAVGDTATEQILYELSVTGPKSFNVGNLKKMYAPGAGLATSSYFTIPTADLPEGTYTASLSATDTHGNSRTAVDTFVVKAPPATSQPAVAVSAISPALVKAFEKFTSSLGKKDPRLVGATGGPKMSYHFGGESPDSKEQGRISIDPLKKWQVTWDHDKKFLTKTTINGKEALIQTYKNTPGSGRNVPGTSIYFITNGRYCNVAVEIADNFDDAKSAFCEKQAMELAKALCDVIDKTDKEEN